MTLHAPQSPDPQPSLLPVRSELVAQHVEQGLLRLAEELGGLAVDRGGDVILLIQWSSSRRLPLARSNAMAAVRRASTPAILVR